ncbi:helix-turn-helix domain-containing protein [Sphingomonas sp. AR_OL41]|uniref:AraC family transcriptional regulator n=1 Tax=Sphingomonas sp. AR_OL41 TaxID=3042729 RepID=UPI00248184FF|nr:helix-turn-helix domain-containing protein [Sphingomonas sp. AR_OL41]MDH7972324.1 helix-turn-helix domain-containing protein [Sphingomonas sp. AR_OL41]
MPEVRFHVAAPPLRDLVTSYYIVDAPGPLHDTLHPEWANIRFGFAGIWEFETFHGDGRYIASTASLFGPTDRGRRFSTSGGSTLGIGLTPLGWLRLVGGDASRVANAIVPLGTMLGVEGVAIGRILAEAGGDGERVAYLDALLTRRAARPGSKEELARRAHAVLIAGEVEDVGDFAARVGVERRRLSRLCLRVFGFTPVRLLARQRFLRTLGAVRDHLDRPLSEIIDYGYYDQAHFNRDFKAFMGMTPMAYFNAPREVLRRAGTERLKALGALVQGLHPV